MYTCVCVYIYLFVCVYIYIFIHTYTHIYYELLKSCSNPKYWQNDFSCRHVSEKIRTISKAAALILSEDNQINFWDTPPVSSVPSQCLPSLSFPPSLFLTLRFTSVILSALRPELASPKVTETEDSCHTNISFKAFWLTQEQALGLLLFTCCFNQIKR